MTPNAVTLASHVIQNSSETPLTKVGQSLFALATQLNVKVSTYSKHKQTASE